MSEQCFPTGWLPGEGKKRNHWKCIACQSTTWFNFSAAQRHEKTAKHQDSVAHQLRVAAHTPSTSTAPPPLPGVQRSQVAGPLSLLLHDVSGSIEESALTLPPIDDVAAGEPLGIDWESISAELGGVLTLHAAKEAVSRLTLQMEHWLVGGEDDDESKLSFEDPTELPDETEELPVAQDSEARSQQGETYGVQPLMYPLCYSPGCVHTSDPLASGARRMPRSQRPDPDWFPWPDKQVCRVRIHEDSSLSCRLDRLACLTYCDIYHGRCSLMCKWR